jgi:hypothetical protein
LMNSNSQRRLDGAPLDLAPWPSQGRCHANVRYGVKQGEPPVLG